MRKNAILFVMSITMLTSYVATALLSAAYAQTEKTEKALMARAMWSAFRCATFAEKNEQPDEQRRLFDFGVKAGREFLQALTGGEITQEEYSSTVPVIVTFNLGGPSIDFMIGRIFAATSRDAYEKFVFDDDFRAINSDSLYRGSNCDLIGHDKLAR